MTKGPLIAQLEKVTEALTNAEVDTFNAIATAQGDESYGSAPLNRREQAERWLGLWFVLGQAADPISVPWWQTLIAEHGPADVALLDQAMHKAWDDTALRRDALAVVGPDIQQQYQWLRGVGLHRGQVRERAQDTEGAGRSPVRSAHTAPSDSPADAPQRATGASAPASGTPMGGGY